MSFSHPDTSGEEIHSSKNSEIDFDFSLFGKESINEDKSVLMSEKDSKIIDYKDCFKDKDILTNDSFTKFEKSNNFNYIFQQNLSNDFPLAPNFPPLLNPNVSHNIQNTQNHQINNLNTNYNIKNYFSPLFSDAKKEEKVIKDFISTNKLSISLINSKNDNNFLKKGVINMKPENKINLDFILAGKEKRTCVRLSQIPKKYSPFDMVKLIDKHLKTEPGKRIYNSIYVPLSKIIGRNIGFCFVNMISPEYVISFYNTFNGFYFNKSKKPCTVVFSDQQNMNIDEEDPLRRPIFFKDHLKLKDN